MKSQLKYMKLFLVNGVHHVVAEEIQDVFDVEENIYAPVTSISTVLKIDYVVPPRFKEVDLPEPSNPTPEQNFPAWAIEKVALMREQGQEALAKYVEGVSVARTKVASFSVGGAFTWMDTPEKCCFWIHIDNNDFPAAITALDQAVPDWKTNI